MTCQEPAIYTIKLTNNSTCPASVIEYQSDPISMTEEKTAFTDYVVNEIINITSGEEVIVDPNNTVETSSFTFNGLPFFIKLGSDPYLVIDGVEQIIPPDNVFVYTFTEPGGNVRVITFEFFNTFFKIKDEDSNLVFSSDTSIISYENFNP